KMLALGWASLVSRALCDLIFSPFSPYWGKWVGDSQPALGLGVKSGPFCLSRGYFHPVVLEAWTSLQEFLSDRVHCPVGVADPQAGWTDRWSKQISQLQSC